VTSSLGVPKINLNNESSVDDTILGIPFSKIITLAKPAFNWASGLIAAFFIAKVNLLGIPGFDQSNVQTYLGAGLTFLTVTGLQQLGDLKWIKGHHIELAGGGLQVVGEEPIDPDVESELTTEIPVETEPPPDVGDGGPSAPGAGSVA
jgi:hypothetical protein